MMAETCSICGERAKRKCTRCGETFCDLHVRYGNPHFAVNAPGAGVGHYCDVCWETYEQEGAKARKVQRVVAGCVLTCVALVFLSVAVGMVGGVAGFGAIAAFILRVLEGVGF